MDDAVRKECIYNTLSTMCNYDMGYYVWTLCAGNMVSTRRDRTDYNCEPGDGGYMAFFTKDGKLRNGHEIIKGFNRTTTT